MVTVASPPPALAYPHRTRSFASRRSTLAACPARIADIQHYQADAGQFQERAGSSSQTHSAIAAP
jgi:hypothetical protein